MLNLFDVLLMKMAGGGSGGGGGGGGVTIIDLVAGEDATLVAENITVSALVSAMQGGSLLRYRNGSDGDGADMYFSLFAVVSMGGTNMMMVSIPNSGGTGTVDIYAGMQNDDDVVFRATTH